MNPYSYLLDAPVLEAPGVVSYEGRFRDDDDSVHQANIGLIYDLGITRGCNAPDNDRYCPSQDLTRGQVAAFLRRYLALPAVEADAYTDDGASIFEEDINALTAAGVGFGCTATEFCPDTELRREEMAKLVVRAFAPDDPDRYANSGDVDWFQDDEDSPYEISIGRLKAAGVTVGCDPPDNASFCPQRPLTRAEMATFLARAITGAT